MNICMLSFETIFSKRGGVETYVHQLSKHFAKAGHKVFVISHSPHSYRNSVNDGVNYLEIPLRTSNMPILRLYSLQMLLFNFKAALVAKRLNKTHHLHIVHAQFCCGFLYGLLSRFLSSTTKFVVTMHGTLVDEQLSRRKKSWSSFLLILMECLSVKCADGIIASSHDTLRNVHYHYKPKHVEATTIYSGVDLERFTVDNTQKTEDPRHDTFNVLYVGRVDTRKRVHLILQAANKLLKKYKNLQFFIVGPGTKQYASYVNNQKSNKSFIFAGTVSEELLTKFYLMSDIFVLPSLYEGFGLVVIEAFAAGKPVIAFNVGSLPELVQNGKNGILLDASTPSNEIANSIETLITNDYLREQMALHAKETAKKFTWTKSCQNTLCFYQRIIQTS